MMSLSLSWFHRLGGGARRGAGDNRPDVAPIAQTLPFPPESVTGSDHGGEEDGQAETAVVLIAAAPGAPWRAWARELTSRGCRLVVTDDAFRALTLAEAHRPRVALLALGKDGFDNFWLTQELRRLRPDVRIVIVIWGRSASSQQAFAEMARVDACVMPTS